MSCNCKACRPKRKTGPTGATGPTGPGETLVPDITTLAGLGAGLPDGSRVIVLTTDQQWELDRSSLAPTDGITIVAAGLLV